MSDDCTKCGYPLDRCECLDARFTVAPFLPGMEGEERKRDFSQFYTPPDLARLVWQWIVIDPTLKIDRVCEPAAGRGALILPMLLSDARPSTIFAFEIDPANCDAMREGSIGLAPEVKIVCGDFLKIADGIWPEDLRGMGPDLVVQNPPFEAGGMVDFIHAALRTAPVTVGIFPASIVYSQGRFEKLWRHVYIERGAWLTERPDFGGEFGAKTDFVVLQIRKRTHPLNRFEPFKLAMEWW